MPVIKEEDIKLITSATNNDPFKFLGIHHLNKKEVVIRVFNPDAQKIEIVSKKLKKPAEMILIAPEGLFECVIASEEIFKYMLDITFKNETKKLQADPYSFLPIISDYDAYLFNEGNHHRVYKKMGAHIMEHQGVKGVHFAVWAPSAQRVSVVGAFNNWDGRRHMMRILGSSGIWELFIPDLIEGEFYRFEVKSKDGAVLLKSDPYAFYTEKRPSTASVVYQLEGKHQWADKNWMEVRKETKWLNAPISMYEVHLGSWKRKEGNQFLNYRELADQLVEYVKQNNYTHIELMPISEHPLDESWGYQVTGYFSTTSRFGKPEELMYLVDKCHQNNIGVILDWVPGHFPKDAHGLGRFDGTALYEHEDPRQGEHMDWGTYIFNYGRNEVRNFLVTNALFWFDMFHIDGVRVDAVASMLYLDYSRKAGEWVPNRFGGRENLEAIEFLKQFNYISHQYYPGVLTIAEESTAFAGVTQPTYLGGLGFNFKWNMGWMHDSLEYIKMDPIYRKYSQNSLTFSMVYAFSENFILPISHDEVVHGKGSLIQKMNGDYWQKFAGLRLYKAYMMAHPGKKLDFMGAEFGQWKEWNCNSSLDWNLLDFEAHHKMLSFTRDINKVYKDEECFWIEDCTSKGFDWIDFKDSQNSVISFMRKNPDKPSERIICVFNFTPVVRENYRVGVDQYGFYDELLNTDSEKYYGSNITNGTEILSQKEMCQGREYYIELNLPPLGAIFLKYKEKK